MLSDAWDRFVLLTLREKCACVVFGGVMHVTVLAQMLLVSWILLLVVGWLR